MAARVLQAEEVTLPQQLQGQMAAYAARFSVVKTPRKLVWMKGLGTVDLSLTVGGQEVAFTVAPAQAAVIMHFKVCTAQPVLVCVTASHKKEDE